jgi:hypothetical protein
MRGDHTQSTIHTLELIREEDLSLGCPLSLVAADGSIGCRPSRHVSMLDITEQRILQQMAEQGTKIVPHGNQHLDAFSDGSRILFDQVAASRLVQSQDGTNFSCLIMLIQTFVQIFQPVVLLDERDQMFNLAVIAD